MIQLLLSGALSPDDFQNNEASSLGGYVSSCKASNPSELLFGGISQFSLTNTKDAYSLLVLKNSITNKAGVTVSIVNPDGSYSTMSIAVVKPSKDNDGNLVFERIPTGYSQPMMADFASPDESVEIGTMAIDDVYGVWVKRVVSPAAYKGISTATLNATFDTFVSQDTDNKSQIDDIQYAPYSGSTDDIVLSIKWN